MLQFPSNWAASAGGAEQMIAKAVHKANARIQLPIMEDLMRVVLLRVRWWRHGTWCAINCTTMRYRGITLLSSSEGDGSCTGKTTKVAFRSLPVRRFLPPWTVEKRHSRFERRERVWSLIVKLLHFANMPPKEDSVGQRNDHCTGSNKVE